MSQQLKEAQARIRGWRENPKQFVHEQFQVTLDPWQEKALEFLAGPIRARRRIMMKACTGPGKSAVLAWIGWWRLSCFAKIGDHPKGAALSGEGRDNLKDNLWSELSKWQKRSQFLTQAFSWNQERIAAVDHPETWFLSARSYPKSANDEDIGRSLSGLHSPFPFLLLDETGAMPPQVGQKAAQIFTGNPEDALLAGAGNPVLTDGLLYHACVNETALWDIVSITADPDDPNRTSRVPIEHAREMIKQYGRDNPWIMATILGEFPKSAVNALFSPDMVEKAMEKHHPESAYSFMEKKLGVDVALSVGTGDRTVLFPRQGLAAFMPSIMRTNEPADISAFMMRLKLEQKIDQEFVDNTGGWGSGVISHYRAAGYTPHAVESASTAIDSKFYNKRAEMWFGMLEWMKSGGALPKVPEIVAELCTPTYTLKKGLLLLEPKDLVKKRLGRSPDIADALAHTFATPDKHRSIGSLHGRPGRLATEYNPLAERMQSDYDPYSR